MATKIIAVDDIQAKIPELLLMISKGDEIIIEKNSRPFAKLTAITGPGGRRIPGLTHSSGGRTSLRNHIYMLENLPMHHRDPFD